MRQILLIITVALTAVVCGCASLPVAQIPTVAIPQTDKVVFEDKTVSPNAGPYMFAEGNIYSCHYGIKKIGSGAMQPNRMVLLHSYLDNQIFKGSQSHTAIVNRFDIYWNRDVALRYHAGVPFAFAGDLAASAATSGLIIGCKDAEEGEYYSSEVPSKDYSAIVIYLNILIDNQRYKIRTVYPVFEDSDTKSRWSADLTAAVGKVFATLDSMVEKDEGRT